MQIRKAHWLPWLLGFTALLPRLAALGRYITPDELIWVYRSVLFREALLRGAWADTLVSGHPGLITTWLGAIGINLQLWLHPPSREVYTWLTQVAFWMPDNMAAFQNLAHFLTTARLLVAITNSLGVVAAYYLARKLWGSGVALLFILLLALDPFVAGLSGLLHVDSLMATFSTLSLLASGLWLRRAEGQRINVKRPFYLIIAAVTAALAILTKSPAVLLLPVTVLFFGLHWLMDVWEKRHPSWKLLGRLAGAGVLWLCLFLLVVLLLFPALWAGPREVWTLLSSNASRHIEEALRPTFFMGSVTYEHGPLFYPVVLAFRLGPVVFVGLLLGAGMGMRRPTRLHGHALPVWLLLCWSFLFIAGISFAAKKFDRYLLPVIPALTLLAALALIQFRPAGLSRRRLWWAGLIGVQAAYLLFFYPYPLAAYNPLLGGPWTAQRVVPVGWGEANSRAGVWLEQNTEAPGEAAAVAGVAPALAPFFPGETLLQNEVGVARADYLVVTLGDRQADPAGIVALTRQWPLLHTIRYGGIDQAWIYRQPDSLPPPGPIIALPAPYAFGEQVQLWGAEAHATATEAVVRLGWELRNPTQERFVVKLTLRDEAGQVWHSIETALLNDVYFYPEDWEIGERPQIRYLLSLPPGIPPAIYVLEVTLFTEVSGAQLPLLDGDGRFQGTAYTIGGVRVEPAPQLPSVSDLHIPIPQALLVAPGLRLMGHAPLPASVNTGDEVMVTLYWQADTPLSAGLEIDLSWIGNEQRISITLPLSRFASEKWRAGELIQEKYTLEIPTDLPGGRYQLQVENATLGSVEVVATDRLFTLPADIPLPLNYLFGEGIYLRGLNPPQPVRAGERARLTLFWQTDVPPHELVTAFVHLLDGAGANVTQSDQWPGGLPTNTRAAGEVIVDEVILDVPPELPPGAYRLAVGLYTAADGLRLPVRHAGGTVVVDDRVLLPVTLEVTD